MTQKAREKFNKEELDDYFTWVQNVWTNSRGEPLDFKDHKYLEGIYKDQHHSIVYIKGAQLGVSERLISEAVWICDRLGKNVLYTFPTSSQLSDFAQARLEPVFNMSDYLSRITGSMSADEMKEKGLDPGDFKKVGKVGLKQVRNGFLYLRGSQNQQQIISVDADVVFLDERDRFMEAHVPYIDKRLLHSTLKWRREASTPTFPGFGVDNSYKESDQREWQVKCPHCGRWQELDFFKNVDLENAEVFCRFCKKKGIQRLGNGRWYITKPENSEVHGYRISGLYNPRRTTKDLVEQYEKAKNSGFSAMQQFYNQVLGMSFEAEGQKILVSELEAIKGDYETPFKTKGTFAGADVGTKIHVVVSDIYNRKNRYVYIGSVSKFFGPRDSLEELMKQYDIKTMVIDAKPETRKVKELAEAFPNKIYAAYYPTRKFDLNQYFIFDDIKSEVYIDRTISLDYLVSDIHNELVQLPSNAKWIPEFYDHMTASVRVTDIGQKHLSSEELKGMRMQDTPQAKWVEKGADHFFHAANYNRIATIKGATGKALLDFYRSPNSNSNTPQSLTGWKQWIKLSGERIF